MNPEGFANIPTYLAIGLISCICCIIYFISISLIFIKVQNQLYFKVKGCGDVSTGDTRSSGRFLLLFFIFVIVTTSVVSAASVSLKDGDVRGTANAPEVTAYANTEFSSSPSELSIITGGSIWRYHQWIALMEQGSYVEGRTSVPTDTVGVQFWGDTSDGWARVLVDGAEVWSGNTYGRDANYPGNAFVKYLEISGLERERHTVRVENTGVAGAGGGDDVTIFFFGLGNAGEGGSTPVSGSQADTGGQVPEASVSGASGDFSFYAVYDRLVDTDRNNVRINQVALSGDGRKLVFSGQNAETDAIVLYTLDADGSSLNSVPLPGDIRSIWDLTIDRDGSRAFFFDMYESSIYNVEGGAATKILDAADYDGVNGVKAIQCTADGSYVYFAEDRDDLWRVSYGGGIPERIIDDAAVSRDGGTGSHLNHFSISDDASKIAFILGGYLDDNGAWINKDELFVFDRGTFRQLTNDDPAVIKEHLDISGDGTTIVYGGKDSWYSIKADGSERTSLAPKWFNIGGLSLTQDGSRVLYVDSEADGGRLAKTDGSGLFDIFPNFDVAEIALGITEEGMLNDDGSRVAFIFQYATWPFKEALYVGHFGDHDAVPGSPVIEDVTFTPSSMPRAADATVVLTSEISDPQGPGDIERTSTDELVDGILEEDSSKLPAYFYYSANDKGSDPDSTAGDGIFSSLGKAGGMVNEMDMVTIRMAAEDSSDTVVVADTVLGIGGYVPPGSGADGQAGASDEEAEEGAEESPVSEQLSPPVMPPVSEPAFAGLSFESRSKAPGSSVQIPLTLHGTGASIGNMDLTLAYDPDVLGCTEVVKGSLTGNSLFESNILDGTIKISFADMEGFSGDGSVAYVKFDVVGSEGASCPLEILRLSANRADDLSALRIPTKDGTFTVIGPDEGLGDAAGDGGRYTAFDALYALLMSVGKLEEHESMDINGDGTVTSVDARMILKMAAREQAVGTV